MSPEPAVEWFNSPLAHRTEGRRYLGLDVLTRSQSDPTSAAEGLAGGDAEQLALEGAGA